MVNSDVIVHMDGLVLPVTWTSMSVVPPPTRATTEELAQTTMVVLHVRATPGGKVPIVMSTSMSVLLPPPTHATTKVLAPTTTVLSHVRATPDGKENSVTWT
jgi:hypothetical protein